MSDVRAALVLLPDLRRRVLPGLLDAVLAGAMIRSRRALRGRHGAEHPRVFIWGLLEARLQTADILVLGGLAETVWPPATDPGPWLSRPMRTRVGLPSPEEAVGQAAHDFAAACCAAPTVVLSCPVRRDGAPAVPARWLTRLDMFLAGRGQVLPEHAASGWARALDLPSAEPRPVAPPAPRPPVRLRPRRLSVTEIETLLRDPYAIHARHILRLPALRPLDEATDAADYGTLVHAGLHHFLTQAGSASLASIGVADMDAALRMAMRHALASADLRPALRAWWGPRLDRIAGWVALTEARRRASRPAVALRSETRGRITRERPGGAFQLIGRADRIERYGDGTLSILDYKTGRPPSQAEVDAGLAPQLLMEAAMAEHGGFEGLAGVVTELAYWHLSGGHAPGAETTLFSKDAGALRTAVATALESLDRLIDDFDAADRAYLSCPNPGVAPRFTDYAQLARVAEWSSAGSSDES